MKSPTTKDTITVTVGSVGMGSFVTAATLTKTTSSTTTAVPSTRKRKRPRRIYQPQDNSLFDLLYTHSGESLFINPILWTDLHLQLLGVKFVTLPRCDTPHPEPSPKPREFPPRMLRLSKQISNILAPHTSRENLGMNGAASRVAALDGMLRAMFPAAELGSLGQLYKQLNIWVWGEPYQAICRLDGLFENSDDSPVLAFINKDGLEFKRRHKLFGAAPGPGGRPNHAVHGLVDLRIKKILPVNRDHDPYLVAIFIAMAQKRFYSTLPVPMKRKKRSVYRGLSMPEFDNVKLHIITNDNGSELSVYTATVTAAFLERFHKPTQTPKTTADALGMTIEHTKVAAWPMLGLKERLGKTLGKDLVCQDFSADEIDAWDDESDSESVATERFPSRTNSEVQASRRILGEISNEKVDDELDEAASPLKKPRLA